MDRRLKIGLPVALSTIFIVYYVLNGDLIRASISGSITVLVFAGTRLIGRDRKPTKVDNFLVNAVVHMYVISLGQIGAEDLIRAVAETREYGYYSRVFQKILYIGRGLGYGLTRATALVAEMVKQPLKDILIRLTNTFSSVDPKGYIEIEALTITEEFSGSYTRTLESLKTVGGVFSTLQSGVVFIIMTLSMMTVFMADPNTIYYAYGISVLTLGIMFFGLEIVSSKEPIIHIGLEPPRLYRILRMGLMVLIAAIVPFALIYIRWDAPAALLTLGVAALIPGTAGYALERRVHKIDEHYPTFLKSLGENMASTTNMKMSLTFILDMELGPLRDLIRRALNRIKLGISNRKALLMMASESASHTVYISNKIFLDAMFYGGDLILVGKILSNHVVKFLEFRKRRLAIAKSFEGITIMMQVMVVALLVIMEFLCGYFSTSLTSLPFFEFGYIPMGFIHLGNFLLVLFLCAINAWAMKEVASSFWGVFLWKFGLLLCISGASWFSVKLLVDNVLTRMMPSLEGGLSI